MGANVAALAGLRVRDARVIDALAVARVELETIRVAYHGAVPDERLTTLTCEELAERWGRIIAVLPERGGCFYVVEDGDGQVVAFAAGRANPTDEEPGRGELGVIVVLPTYHRQGVGRRLVGLVARHLAGRGLRSMIVRTLRDTAQSRRFYEALGGTLVEERRAEFYGVPVDEVTYHWADVHALVPLAEDA